jgi:hypothetical protein
MATRHVDPTATPYAGVLPGASLAPSPSYAHGLPNWSRYTRSSAEPAASLTDANAGTVAALHQPRHTRRSARWEACGTRARQSTARSSGRPGMSSTCSGKPRAALGLLIIFLCYCCSSLRVPEMCAVSHSGGEGFISYYIREGKDHCGREGSLRYVEWGPIIRTILKFERKLAGFRRFILLEKAKRKKNGKRLHPFSRFIRRFIQYYDKLSPLAPGYNRLRCRCR